MNYIYDAFNTLWGTMSDYGPQNILSCFVALCCFALVYFLFLRFLLKLCRSTTLLKITDFLFIVVCVCTIIYYIPPSININKFLTEVTEAFS